MGRERWREGGGDNKSSNTNRRNTERRWLFRLQTHHILSHRRSLRPHALRTTSHHIRLSTKFHHLFCHVGGDAGDAMTSSFMVHRAGLRHVCRSLTRTDFSQMWFRSDEQISRFMCLFYCSDFLKSTWTQCGFIRRQVCSLAGFLINFCHSGFEADAVGTTQVSVNVLPFKQSSCRCSDDHLTGCCLLWCCGFKPPLVCKISISCVFGAVQTSWNSPNTPTRKDCQRVRTEMHLQESDWNQRTAFHFVGFLKSIWIRQNKRVNTD